MPTTSSPAGRPRGGRAGLALTQRARCLTPGCDWTPDPTARTTVDSQAERHTKATGHGTLAWAVPTPPATPPATPREDTESA